VYELVQNPHSPPCGHTIIIDRPHFINFRHFGNVNRGDSAYYTFFITLLTLLLLLPVDDPLLSILGFLDPWAWWVVQ
jgi:hypothetical protein